MRAGHDLSLFQKILLATDGTVTDLIALYSGEDIRVRKLEQTISVGVAPAALMCDGPTRLLHRCILLSGPSRNYLHAESQFVVERLPQTLRDQMLQTDRPIGLLWTEARLETFREIVGQQIAPCARIAHHFAVPDSEAFVTRSYCVHHRSKPLGLITEAWPISHFR